jgi:hypothetical protein
VPEVLHWERSGPDGFLTRVAVAGGDPLAVGHALRAAAIVCLRDGYGVPPTHRLVLRRLACHDLRPVGDGPLELRITGHDPQHRRGELLGLRLVARASAGDGPPARAVLELSCFSPVLYRMVRRRDPAPPEPPSAPPVPLPPAEVGRPGPADVLAGARQPDGRWPLCLRAEHLSVGGEPADHVPGLVLLEGARQAVAGQTGRTGTAAVDAEFPRYAEPDAPVRVTVEATARPDVVVARAEQGGGTVLAASFTLR